MADPCFSSCCPLVSLACAVTAGAFWLGIAEDDEDAVVVSAKDAVGDDAGDDDGECTECTDMGEGG